jgi:hypothetical protein
MATQLRNTPQLTRYDDDTYLNLTDEQNKIAKERIKEVEIRNLANTTNNYYNTTNVAKANAEDITSLPGQPPNGPPPPARIPKMSGAATQTAMKPSQNQASGSGDPYFGGVGGGYQPPPGPPPAGGRPSATLFQDDLEQRIRQDHIDGIAHLEEMKRIRDESKAKLLAQIRIDFGTQKRTTEAEMVDANMGGGPPPPPPGAAGFVMNEVDTINKKKTRQSPYGPQVFNMANDRGKRGGPRPGPAPDMPAYETTPPIQQIPSGGGRPVKIKQTKNDKKSQSQRAREARRRTMRI